MFINKYTENMNKSKQLYLVCYDVRDPHRLNKALHIVRDYATGGQKSVFECYLDSQQFHTLRRRLQSCLASEDRAMITRIHPQSVQVFGKGIKPVGQTFIYIA